MVCRRQLQAGLTIDVASAADSIPAVQRCAMDGPSVFCCAKHTKDFLLTERLQEEGATAARVV
jgi:hypothetical protein